MTFFAVSDLHIRDEHDPLYAPLVALFTERARPGDHVVLAGDIFDVFVGDKPEFTERYGAFIGAARDAAARGVHVYYVEGNHDFLMTRALPGVRVHARAAELVIGGKRVFVGHGDLADARDWGYRALRVFFRSPLFRAFVHLAPRGWLSAIGRRSSRYSRGDDTGLAAHLPRERLEALRCVYRSFAAERVREGFDFVVLGHCHDLDEKSFTLDGREAQYINVGYPRAHGSFLTWNEGDARIQRERFV
jgi:UDP-2,3-diacylglucosamine hydrolase